MKRKAWVSFLLSLFRPGLGHMYNGQLKKGILFDCLFIGIYNLLIIAITFYSEHKVLNIVVFLLSFLLYLIFATISSITSLKIGSNFVPKSYNKWHFYGLYVIGISWIINYPVTTFVETHLARSYKIPTGAMKNTILIGDYLLADLSVYKGKKNPLSGDIIIFNYFGVQKKTYIKRIIGLSGQTIMIAGKNVYVNGRLQNNPPESEYIRNGSSLGFPDTFSVTIPSPGETVPVNNLDLRDFLFMYHLIKQENKNVEAEIMICNNGEFLRAIPLSKVDNWILLKEYVDLIKSQIDNFSLDTQLKIGGKVVSEYMVKNDNFFVLGDNRDNSLDSRFFGYVNKKSIKGKAKLLYFSIDRNESIMNIFKGIRWNRIGMKI